MGYAKVDIKLRDDKRGLESAVRLFEESDLPEQVKDTILGVKVNGRRAGGLMDKLTCGEGRKRKYIQQWRYIARWLGKDDLREADKEDIKRVYNKINLRYPDELHRGINRAKTRRDYRQALKKLYTLLEGEGDVPPPKVAWIKTGLKRKQWARPSFKVLTVQERIQLIESSKYLRDKAMIACLCDGLRPDELLYMRVGDIKTEDGICWAVVSGYKGTGRVDFIYATPFLLQWLDSHPFKDNPFSPLWVHLRAASEHDYIKSKTLEKIVDRAARRAEEKYGLVKDRIYAYLFRHSRVTDLAGKMYDEELDEYFRWVPGSPMPSIYVHLSGRRTGKKVKRIHGIVKEEDEDQDYRLKQCHSCRRVNPPNNDNCYHCGEDLSKPPRRINLTEEEITAIYKLHEFLARNPRLLTELQKLGKSR